ncbi:hypothetical protein D9M72_343340 [compost metagenome]
MWWGLRSARMKYDVAYPCLQWIGIRGWRHCADFRGGSFWGKSGFECDLLFSLRLTKLAKPFGCIVTPNSPVRMSWQFGSRFLKRTSLALDLCRMLRNPQGNSACIRCHLPSRGRPTKLRAEPARERAGSAKA